MFKTSGGKYVAPQLLENRFKQSRFIATNIKIKNIKKNLINIYVPNGNPVDTDKYFYKLDWLSLLIKFIEKKIKN